MNPRQNHAVEAGFTFAELAMAMLVLVITSAVLINQVTMHLKSSTEERDRVFAMTKAQALIAEMQTFVEKALPGDSGDLDSLDDGIVNKATLTIARDARGRLVAPDDVLSGNSRTYGGWMWSRRITVQPFPGAKNRNVRYATVRLYKRDGNNIDRVVAELSAVVNAPGTAYPTTQVFDLYLLAIENIPGWWVFMDSIKPFVESTITDLETRNPGLEVRTHWITKASFGRDPVYRPHFNESVDSNQDHSHVYYYPSKMPAGSASTYYYVPANVKAHIEIDGADAHGHSDENPYPYALADYWNNAMRYPEEVALWQKRVDAVTDRENEILAAIAHGTTPPPALDDMSKEPTLRLFLEDLNTNPDKYKNALIINLHGELLPMPALRNYSDAAKAPRVSNLRNLRVVTHPEQLRTARDPAGVTTESAAFRVYAYDTYAPTPSNTITPVPIVLEVLGMNLYDASTPTHLKAGVELRNLPGGVTIGTGGSATNAYPTWTVANNWGFGAAKLKGDGSLLQDEMRYEVEFVTSEGPAFTRITLHNTPCVATRVGNAGLDSTTSGKRSQLYSMTYIPGPCESARDFTRNLACTTSSVYPKNTARWRLSIGKQAFSAPLFVADDGTALTTAQANVDRTLAVRTRLWTDNDAGRSGTMWPAADRKDPENLSTTYTWWTDSAADVPITERSQFLGDPRHNPYKDLCNGDPDFPNGYNWFFDSMAKTGEANVSSDYPALASGNLKTGWMSRLNCDVPRLFEVLRKGLTNSACVYTTLTGWSYYYLGIGNDVGYDSANGYANSIPVHMRPHGGTGTSYLNTITGARTFVRDADTATTFWWSIPWLGELYPDSAYDGQWYHDASGTPAGNLVAGTTSGNFYQSAMNSVHSAATSRQGYGVTMNNRHQNTGSEGCTSFFNIGTGSSSTFHHTGSSGDGTLTTTGLELADNYNFRFPASAPVSRPFGVAASASGGVGTEFSTAPYSTERFAGSLYKTYMTHSAGTGSGLVKLEDTAAAHAGYIVVNGFDRTIESGSTFIAKYAVLSLIHSYFEAGKSGNALRIKPPPRVEIRTPTDISELIVPDQIDIVLRASWTRWDGQPYSTSGTYAEDETELDYVLTYSNDGGNSWRYIQDNASAAPGVRPTSSTYIVADAGIGDDTVTWDVPSGTFPQGSYYLRVDCYRRGATIHYSYHKTKLFIKR